MHTQEWKLYPSSQLSLLPPIPSPSLTCCCGSSRLNAYPYDDDDDDNNIDALLTAAVPVIVDDKAAYYPLPPPPVDEHQRGAAIPSTTTARSCPLTPSKVYASGTESPPPSSGGRTRC